MAVLLHFSSILVCLHFHYIWLLCLGSCKYINVLCLCVKLVWFCTKFPYTLEFFSPSMNRPWPLAECSIVVIYDGKKHDVCAILAEGDPSEEQNVFFVIENSE